MTTNNLRRWTSPTNLDFYHRNSDAMTRYKWLILFFQGVAIYFSLLPIQQIMVAAAPPFLLPYVTVLILAVLLAVHYFIHQEILYCLSNLLDKDEGTINHPTNWILPIILVVSMLTVDYFGSRENVRSKLFKGDYAALDQRASNASTQAQTAYNTSISVAHEAYEADSAAIVSNFSAKIAQIKAKKTYDQSDVAFQKRQIKQLQALRLSNFATIRSEYSKALKMAKKEYLNEKNRINGLDDTDRNDYRQKDKAADQKADLSGVFITLICWVAFGLLTYRYTLIRVKCGIKLVAQFSELRASGSIIHKFTVASGDIISRQGHKLVVFYHKLGTYGTAILKDLDGNIILQENTYNTAATATSGGGSGSTGGGATSLPPPPPPSSGGSSGGGGGSMPTNPTTPVPEPTERPTNVLFSALTSEDKMKVCETFHNSVPEINRQFLMKSLVESNPTLIWGDNSGTILSLNSTEIYNKALLYQQEADEIMNQKPIAIGTKPIAISLEPQIEVMVVAKNNAVDDGLKQVKKVLQAYDRQIQTQTGKFETNIEGIKKHIAKADDYFQQHPSPGVEGDVFNYILSLKKKYQL